MNIRQLIIATAIAVGVSACQSTPDKSVSEMDTRNSIDVVESDVGQSFTWGGEILDTNNLTDSTELTVLGYPLDKNGQPEYDETSTGRFIAVYSGFLEPTDFRKGALVTVTGDLQKIRDGKVAEAPYRFPVLRADDIKLQKRKPKGFSLPFSIGIGIGI